MAGIASAGLVAFALFWVPWDWIPGGNLTPMSASELFSRTELARAEEFASRRRLLRWSSYGVSLAVAALLGLTPLGAQLTRRLTRRAPWWTAVGVGVLLLLALGRLATFPLALLVRQQSLEYELTRQPLAGWLADLGKGLLVSWVMTTLVVIVVVGLARQFPRRWFLLAGSAAATLTFAGSYLYPVLVEPLFNDFESMPAGPFRASVMELADRENVHIDDVLVTDASRRTTTFNAYVSGLWGTRHVVVYDTLLNDVTRDQARVVIAHELAHAKHRDVLIGTSLGALGSLVAAPLVALLLDTRRFRRIADISGPGDPAAVAALLAAFAVVSLLGSPLMNTVSRALEARADRVALLVTRDDEVFVQIHREMALKAIHDPTPPTWSQLWFGSHPTVLQRAGLPGSLESSR